MMKKDKKKLLEKKQVKLFLKMKDIETDKNALSCQFKCFRESGPSASLNIASHNNIKMINLIANTSCTQPSSL